MQNSNNLARYTNGRHVFVGTFIRAGRKRGDEGGQTTLLFRNIVDAVTGESVDDHVWILGTDFGNILPELEEGVRVIFESGVRSYVKKKGQQLKYKFTFPRALNVVKEVSNGI
jgi:hypothetical protein